MKSEEAPSLAITAALLLVGIGIFGIHSLPTWLERRVPHLDLSQSWEACARSGEARPELTANALADCHWLPMRSRTLPQSYVADSDWIIYRARFSPPSFCRGKNSLCTLMIGVLSDPTEAYLNERYVGRLGHFSPQNSYSQTYPAAFPLPGLGAENEVILLSRLYNRFTNGMLRQPVAVYAADDGRVIEEVLIGENVIVPLTASLLMILFGAFALIGLQRPELNSDSVRSYTIYCFAMGLYLLSLTRIPRQYLPLDLAYSIHFGLRLFVEFLYLGLIGKLLPLKTRGFSSVRGIYLALTAAIFLLLPLGLARSWSADLRISWIYRLSVIGVDIIPLTYLVAIPMAIRARRSHPLFLPIFASIALMQAWDVLAINGWVDDVYFVRMYPVPLALVLGFTIWQAGWRGRRQQEISAEIGKVATQVAHDLRSPLGALRIATEGMDYDKSKLVHLATERIQGICSSLLQNYRNPEPTSCDLRSLVEPVLFEFESTLKTRAVDVTLRADYEAFPARALVEPNDFKRTLSNLLNNSLEALPDECGEVTVAVRGLRRHVEVEIRDSGRGIPEDRLATLFQRGNTYAKPHGYGFGLSFAKETVEKWRGEICVQSTIGEGTSVQLRFPRA